MNRKTGILGVMVVFLTACGMSLTSSGGNCWDTCSDALAHGGEACADTSVSVSAHNDLIACGCDNGPCADACADDLCSAAPVEPGSACELCITAQCAAETNACAGN